MMEQLQNSKRQLQGMFGLDGLSEKQKKLLLFIFCKQAQKVHIQGNEAAKFIQSLQKNKNDVEKRQQEALQKFHKEINRITIQLLDLEKEVIGTLFRQKPKVIMSSKIISSNKIEDINFINQSLQFPKQYQLLYRASQSNYLASQFHKKCDNIKHTLVIAKTQYGNLIVSYTPTQWKLNSRSDPTNKACLLSISLKQKMNLINSNQAIYYKKQHGPGFGSESWDLFISNKCNTSNQYISQIPESFDCGKYKNLKQVYNPFTGAKFQDRFNIQDYEVFRVSW